MTTGVVLLLYRFVPARHLKLGDSLAGAIVTALLLLLISLVSGVIYERTRSISVIYSSLTVGARLPLLGLSLRLRAPARRGGRGRLVAALDRPERAADASDPPRRPRAVRAPGPARGPARPAPRADRPAVSADGLGQLGERLPHLREVRLQLGGARKVGLALQVAAQLPLAQPQQHLGARSLRDPLARGRGIELGEKATRSSSGGTSRRARPASAGAPRDRSAPRRGRPATRAGRDARRRPPAPRARAGSRRRGASSAGSHSAPGARRRTSRRRDPGERLARQVEPVGEEPERLLALG